MINTGDVNPISMYGLGRKSVVHQVLKKPLLKPKLYASVSSYAVVSSEAIISCKGASVLFNERNTPLVPQPEGYHVGGIDVKF